eukprot:3023093-Pleurochrysis_carterae.AAC.1
MGGKGELGESQSKKISNRKRRKKQGRKIRKRGRKEGKKRWRCGSDVALKTEAPTSASIPNRSASTERKMLEEGEEWVYSKAAQNEESEGGEPEGKERKRR